MAPETFRRVYSEKSDVWSYGALLVEMLSGTIPFGSNLGLADVIVGVRYQGWTPLVVMGPQATQVDIQWLQTAPKYLVLLMKLCFQREASERPSFSEIVAKEEARIQKRTEKREKLLKAIDEIAIS
jgi:serine/threonine protein kinase